MNSDFDVIVIGGGLAGLCAAVRAAQLGLSTCLLEQGENPGYRCNTRVSGGVFHVAHKNIDKPPEMLLAAIMTRTHGQADAEQAGTLAAQAGPTADWLVSLGADFVRAGAQADHTRLAAPPRPLGEKLDWFTTWEGRGPDRLLNLLAARLTEFGGRCVLGARARRLRMRDGVCTGVEACIGTETSEFTARAVVIADGGFQTNLDLLREGISAAPEGVLQRNAGASRGDGLLMAKAAGAALSDLKGFYGHVLSRNAMGKPRLSPYPLLDELATNGVVVDGTGQRFCDEGHGGVHVANAIAALADPLSAFVICDNSAWEATRDRPHVAAPNPRLCDLGGGAHFADTVEELADAAGLPRAVLASTVSAHNRGCHDGFESIQPPRTASRYRPRPIETKPLWAFPVCAGITYTMGGIRIDGDARVVSSSGGPIPGLYAAGSATGGLEGGSPVAYVSGLTKAAVFGRQAAEAIGALSGKVTNPAVPPASNPRRYRMLEIVSRFGAWMVVACSMLSVIAGIAVAISAGGILGLCGLAAGGIFGAIVLVAGLSYVELVRVILETLVVR